MSRPRSRIALSALAGVLLSFCALDAVRGDIAPEDDRREMVEFFRLRFPQVPLDEYIHGAMIANRDGKAQYDQIMEFPPFIGDLDKGRKIWETPFRNGKKFSRCFPDEGRNVLGRYPYYDEAREQVITFEMSLNECLRRNGEAPFDYGNRETMGVLSAYARSLSDGMPIDVKIDSRGARKKYEAGRSFFFRRIGQLNAACSGCHYYNAGNIMRMEIISPALGHAAHWPIYRGGEELMTFQGRFKRCMEQMRAVPSGYASDEWNNLEYFLTYLSNGLPLQANVFRK